jgi:glutamyl/glutaminyl-tRNA synthetase
VRALAVLRPVRVVIANLPPGFTKILTAVNNPEDVSAGPVRCTFAAELYIERDDFMENPPKKFFRLSPGAEVRLRYGYIIKCERVVKDAAGDIVELQCTADLESLDGATATRRVKGTIHWVAASHAVDAEVRLYERLLRRGSGRGRPGPSGPPEPGFARASDRLQGGGVAGHAGTRLAVPVRAPRLFLRGPRFAPRAPVFNRP